MAHVEALKIEDLGARVLRLRRERGWSQEKLARVTELSRATIVSVEDNTNSPKLATVQRIADAFEMTLAQLLTGLEATPHQWASAEERETVGAARWSA